MRLGPPLEIMGMFCEDRGEMMACIVRKGRTTTENKGEEDHQRWSRSFCFGFQNSAIKRLQRPAEGAEGIRSRATASGDDVFTRILPCGSPSFHWNCVCQRCRGLPSNICTCTPLGEIVAQLSAPSPPLAGHCNLLTFRSPQ